jgi:transposase
MLWQRGKAYSQDLRSRVFALADEGMPVGRTAKALRVSVSYVSKVLSRRRETDEVSARPQRCHLKPRLAGLHDAIRGEVAARPDATIAELRRWLAETHKVSASDGLMHKTLATLGLTYKKRRCTPPSRRAPMWRRRGRLGATASLA